MKKLLSLLLSIMLLASMLTGCVEKTESLDSDLLIDSTAQGEAMSDSENEALFQTKEGLQITLNGENEATITLNDEAIGELDSTTLGDEGQLINEINVYFSSENEEFFVSLNIIDKHFNIYAESPDAQEPLWNHSDNDLDANRTDKSFSVTINQVGIASVIKQCSEYKIEFNTFEPWECKVLAEGSISEILSEGENQQLLQVIFPNDETIKFKVYGEEAKTSFYNYEQMRINIYESEKQINADNPCPSVEFRVEAASENTGEGRIYAIGYSQDESGTGQVIAEDSNNSEGRTLGTDYGVVMKYKNENIREYVKPEYLYELYLGNDKVETGKVSDIFVEDEYTNIPAIPTEFISGDEYDTWFVPVTDNYKIIEIVQEDNQFGTPCWYQRMGRWVYGSEEPYFNEDVKTVYLLSFDEFGVVDSKMKIMYESETALQSDIYANLGDYIVAETLTGVNEPDDSIITSEFVESCDKEVFDNYTINSNIVTYEYIGHSEHTRYLSYHSSSFESELFGIYYWGVTNTDYSDFQYSSNEITEGTLQDIILPYRTYSYQQNPNAATINLEEERKNYNTAPNTWQEHPYVSYLPEIPSEITVKYVEGLTINETNLALCTEVGGCTREQAENYIEAFSNMKYENEIVELRFEVEDDSEHWLVRYLEGNIRILISWRIEEQRLFIYADKD